LVGNTLGTGSEKEKEEVGKGTSCFGGEQRVMVFLCGAIEKQTKTKKDGTGR